MTRPISLAHLSTIDLPPPRMIHLAAELGYDAVGLRLLRVTDTSPGYPLMDDPAMMAETLAALAETGLRVQDIEFLRFTPGIDLPALRPFLEAGQRLGARYAICAPYDPDLGRLAANLAAFAELSAPYGIRPVLEFFPWTNVPDLAAAIAVTEAAGDERLGILVDALHLNRSGSDPALMAGLPAHRLPFLHLCDAPVHPPYTTEELLFAGREERLAPGDGQIDIAAILAQAPADVPVALEIPMTALAREKGCAHTAAYGLRRMREILKR
ncbi:sugar phosphate isomerase/epimerase family protein [Paracoccus aminovorans]|uniref:sugar phosphate isomerase/epimerase family protein n=1 Tax=Paracoccus aminovorans TaxID=34004 RepID=UPI002B25E91F|nr:sugar phosphate isomerase/epimerase [Paracoccus aminovorans]